MKAALLLMTLVLTLATSFTASADNCQAGLNVIVKGRAKLVLFDSLYFNGSLSKKEKVAIKKVIAEEAELAGIKITDREDVPGFSLFVDVKYAVALAVTRSEMSLSEVPYRGADYLEAVRSAVKQQFSYCR